MAARKDIEISLYKHKLNEHTLIDILPRLTIRTIQCIMNDLDIVQKCESGDSDNVYVFTDGGCKNNGRKNAKGGYGVFFTDKHSSDYFKLNKVGLILNDATNQKAELTAMYHLFRILHENVAMFAEKTVVVCSDSMYSIKCIKEWSKKWEKNEWKTSKGDAVKNSELIKKMLNLKKQCEEKKINVVLKHVMSHTVAPVDKTTKEYHLWYGNYMVDQMINEYIMNESGAKKIAIA